MTLPRASCLRGAQRFGRTAFRRTANQARGSPFRNAGRRNYASGHEAKQSSDLPWMIGSIVFTVPAATWLLGQAPAKSSHGEHGHEEKHEESAEAEPQEDSKDENQGKEDESEAESKEQSKDDEPKEKPDDDSKEDSKGDSKDDAKDDSADEPEEKSDEASEGSKSGKKARLRTETKGEKDAQSNFSGAKHPYIDDPEKSKKSAGPTETAKIHGTAKPTYANDDKQDPPTKDE